MGDMMEYNATLVGRMDVSPVARILQILPDSGVPEFEPGQFTVLGLARSAPRLPEADAEEPVAPEKAGRLLRRAYSITSAVHNKAHLEFYVSLVASGELTPRLFMLSPGDRLFVGPKTSGLFTLDRARVGSNVLMVATGTGLAPYMSMLRSSVLSRPLHRIAVLHGARYSWDLGFRAELHSLANHSPQFRYVPVVSRPEGDPDWQGRTGRLNPWLIRPELQEATGFDLDPLRCDVFLCGHPEMVEQAEADLAGMGFNQGTRKEPGNLHLEKYW